VPPRLTPNRDSRWEHVDPVPILPPEFRVLSEDCKTNRLRTVQITDFFLVRGSKKWNKTLNKTPSWSVVGPLVVDLALWPL